MPDHSAEIAELEQIVNSATSRITTDGTSTSIDLDHAQKRLNRLKAEHDGNSETSATNNKRQRMIRYRFS